MLLFLVPREIPTSKEAWEHTVAIFQIPATQLMVVVLWLGIFGVFARRPREAESCLERGYAVNVSTMFMVWIMMFMFLCCGVESVQWLAFSVYGLPW